MSYVFLKELNFDMCTEINRHLTEIVLWDKLWKDAHANKFILCLVELPRISHYHGTFLDRLIFYKALEYYNHGRVILDILWMRPKWKLHEVMVKQYINGYYDEKGLTIV